MAVFERETRIHAPLSTVWEFHSTVDGLRALTPPWLHLRLEKIERPDGEDANLAGRGDNDGSEVEDGDGAGDEDTLLAGTRLYLSVRPFDVGPRQHWTSLIEEREDRADVAYFVDEMVDGPFPSWRHFHMFYDDGPATLLRDRVVYEPPGQDSLADWNPLGVPVTVGLHVFFRYRHRRTHDLLDEW